MPPSQILGYQLTLFGPRGADYVRHITTAPPIFLDDAASLSSICSRCCTFFVVLLDFSNYFGYVIKLNEPGNSIIVLFYFCINNLISYLLIFLMITTKFE